jgi:hypothetical protein
LAQTKTLLIGIREQGVLVKSVIDIQSPLVLILNMDLAYNAILERPFLYKINKATVNKKKSNNFKEMHLHLS